jgi:hypothetical protein
MSKGLAAIVLMIIYHALSYSWEAFSIEIWVKPFPFMVYEGGFENGIRLVTYVSYVSNFLFVPRNTLLREIAIISLIICIFDLFWYVVFYNNPYSIPELAIKGVVIVLVFFILINAKNGYSNINSDN